MMSRSRLVLPHFNRRSVFPVLEYAPSSCKQPHSRDVMVLNQKREYFWLKNSVGRTISNVLKISSVYIIQISESLQSSEVTCFSKNTNCFEKPVCYLHSFWRNAHSHNYSNFVSMSVIRRSRFCAFSLLASAFIKFASAFFLPRAMNSPIILTIASMFSLEASLEYSTNGLSRIISPVPVLSHSRLSSGYAFAISKREPSVMLSLTLLQNPLDKPQFLSKADGLMFFALKNAKILSFVFIIAENILNTDKFRKFLVIPLDNRNKLLTFALSYNNNRCKSTKSLCNIIRNG